MTRLAFAPMLTWLRHGRWGCTCPCMCSLLAVNSNCKLKLQTQTAPAAAGVMWSGTASKLTCDLPGTPRMLPGSVACCDTLRYNISGALCTRSSPAQSHPPATALPHTRTPTCPPARPRSRACAHMHACDHQVGAARWIGVLVAVWGVVAACFCTLGSASGFYWLRFLLGAAEAGAFPAIWWVGWVAGWLAGCPPWGGGGRPTDVVNGRGYAGI